MTVGWEHERSGATPTEVAALEQSLGGALPADYRSFLLEHDGGTPEANAFDDDLGVTEFFGVSGTRETLERMAGRVPRGSLPVADAEGGNLVLLDLESGAVMFWDHELEDDLDEAVNEIAPDFAVFLRGLKPFDASQVQLKPGQVISVWTNPDFVEPEE